MTRFEVSSTGTVESDSFAFAESGHLSHRRGRYVNGERDWTSDADYEFDILFEDARFELSDEEYTKPSTIEVPRGVHVLDPDGIAEQNIIWATQP